MAGFTHTKLLYPITEARQLLSMSKTEIYRQIKAERLRTVGEGHARRVPAAAIDAYVALLEREANEEAA